MSDEKRWIASAPLWGIYTDFRDEINGDKIIYFTVTDTVSVEVSAAEGCMTKATIGMKQDTWDKVVAAYNNRRTP